MHAKQLVVGTIRAAVMGMVLAAGTPASANDYYVSDATGNDGNSGASWAAAFKTIAKGMSVATHSDTVLVTNGTYVIGNVCITNKVGATLLSVNGYAYTTIQGVQPGAPNGAGILLINHPNAVVDGFKVTGGNRYNGGVALLAGTLQNCWITGNYGWSGAVELEAGGTVRNCLITDNAMGDGDSGGGVYFWSGGVVDSCTITKNTGGRTGGVRNVGSTGTIRNSIIHGNSSSGVKQDFDWTAPANIFNNCITRDYTTGGSGNITSDPAFVNWSGGDYHLGPASPCRDKGAVQSWMSGAKDLGRVVPRVMPVGGTNDMGCFEFNTSALTCSFSASPLYGFSPLPVTFSATVSGDANGLVYMWDIGADGFYEAVGGDKASLAVDLGIGRYSVALRCTNAAGSIASITNVNCVKVGPRNNYVDAAGPNPIFPYTTWATASTNIQTAIDVGVPGTLTLVTNGLYAIRNACITNDAGVTLRSVNGYAHTTVMGDQPYARGTGIFLIDHPSAVVDGFTITGSMVYAGGVELRSGLIQNCWITGNHGWQGGGLSLAGGIARNCLISGNTAGDGGGGVDFSASAGLVESCTIAGNSCGAGMGGGGVLNRYDGGIIRNTIVHDNTTAGGVYPVQVHFRVKNDIDHSCITRDYSTGPEWARTINGDISANGNTTNDPRFVNAAGGDFRPGRGSPCIDTGITQGWMAGARDLVGNPRVMVGAVDMGVLEVPPPGMLLIVR